MIFNIAICDDEPKDIEILQTHLQKISMELDVDFKMTIYNNSRNILAEYTASGLYHILFLDVEMPFIDGIELAKRIWALPDRSVRIIFVSSYPRYMKESFDVQAFQYLTKPYSYEDLRKIIIQIIQDYENSQMTKLLVHTDFSEELVNLSDIISVRSLNSKQKLLLVVMKQKEIEVTGLIGDWEKELGNKGFVSPCRGFLINIQHLHYFKVNELVMSDGSIIPLSRRKEKNIRGLFNKNLLIVSMKR